MGDIDLDFGHGGDVILPFLPPLNLLLFLLLLLLL